MQRNRTDAAALDLAQESALEAMEALLDLVRNPDRHSQAKLTAACKILEIAGVGALEADRRHEELLTALKGKVSKETHAEVLRALARHPGTDSGGAGGARSNGTAH